MDEQERRARHAAYMREYRLRPGKIERERFFRQRWVDHNPDKAREYRRRWREKNAEKIREYARAEHARKPEQTKARNAANYAKESGRLAAPDACEGCGDVGRLEMHHVDYSRPLEVVFLCKTCHDRTIERPRMGEEAA